MALKDLLKPVKFADEQVLRQYTKLAKKCEDRGVGKYALSAGLNGVAKLALVPAWVTSISNHNNISAGIAFGASVENTLELFIYNITAYEAEKLETCSGVKDPFVEKMKSVYSNIRLPVLAGAASQIGIGVANLHNYFFEGDGSALPIGVQQMFLGAGLLSWSSAMYVRDSNPKLLDKKPFWKTTYEKAKNKVRDLIPEQNFVPSPVSIRSCNALESYVK